jgi:hypothetical protein
MPGLGEEPARLARAVGLEAMQHVFRFGLEAVRHLSELARELDVGWEPGPAVMLARRPPEAADLQASSRLPLFGAPPARPDRGHVTRLEHGGPDLSKRDDGARPEHVGPVLSERGEAARPEHGGPVLLDRDEITRRIGPGFLNGLLFPEAGLYDPVKLNHALARAAAALGATLVFGARLERIDETASGLRLTTSSGPIDADLLIHATGAGGNPCSRFLRGAVLTARVQILGTAPVARGPSLPGTATSGLEYWRRGPAGELWLGGFRYLALEGGLEPPGHEVESDERGLEPRDSVREGGGGLEPRIIARQEAVAAELCGGPPEITHRWIRRIDLGCDGLPLVGALPGQPRQLALTAFGGLDGSYGLLAARSLVEALLERPVASPVPALFEPRRMM